MPEKSDSASGRSAFGTECPPPLVGRAAERGMLERLLTDVRSGGSPVLVLRGAAGIGKSALLDHLTAEAAGCRVAAAAGVRAEMELPFAAVHQLCVPMLDLLDGLPARQRHALGTAFGMRAGPVPDLSVLGTAVLGLLARAAEQRPLVCVVDDAQWLDPASARLLTEAARGLAVASTALVFAVREPAETDVLPDLPALEVGGLPDDDARTLVSRAVPGPLDERVRDRILSEARGNPRALLELPRAVSAGGFPAAATGAAAPDRLRRKLDGLPPGAQTVLLLAAAEPAGDPDLLRRAAALLGTDTAAVDAAGELVEVGDPVRFRDPFDRSAVYDAAGPRERRRVHRALAEATGDADADRRAWHRAHGAAHPDEGVAADLERSAGRARERGGLAAAAAFLERAAALTPEAGRQAERVLAAAEAAHLAGALASARALLAAAGTGPLGRLQQARADVLRGRLDFAAHRGGDAPLLLVRAAERLEPLDAGRARAAYLDAVSAAMFAGRLARPGGGVQEVARAAGAAPRPPHAPRASDLLLDGFAILGKEGTAAAAPVLRQALAAFGDGLSADEELGRLWPACVAAWHLWDDSRLVELSARFVELARGAGALGELPLALTMRAQVLLLTGDLAAAEALIDEVPDAMEAAGGRLAPYGALALAALRGREAETSALVEATAAEAAERGEGLGIAAAELATAVLGNGLGRYGDALASTERAAGHERDPGVGNWAAVELVEAAARSGSGEAAAGALRRVTETAAAGGTDWALGVAARSRALLADADAERLHLESIDRLGRTLVRADLARAHLLYGERLRRERRRAEAREHLRAALDLFTGSGMAAFAHRAARELRATGEAVRERTAETAEALTPREAEIAGLARAGLTNKEIATRLYVSPRTVEHHLRQVFTKLGITSRHQLEDHL